MDQILSIQIPPARISLELLDNRSLWPARRCLIKDELVVEEVTPSSVLKKTLVLAFTIALERCASRVVDAARASYCN